MFELASPLELEQFVLMRFLSLLAILRIWYLVPVDREPQCRHRQKYSLQQPNTTLFHLANAQQLRNELDDSILSNV